MLFRSISSENLSSIKTYSQQLKSSLKDKFEPLGPVQIIGPKPAPIEKMQNRFRWNMLIKHPEEKSEEIKNLLENLPAHDTALRVIMDFDPRTVL